jgi:RNA polymerase sigma-70 factor (ECF subfamily)
MQVSKLPDECNTREFLIALRAGKEDAFSRLFLKYYPPLFSYASRLLNDENEAEECVHDTFCHLWDVRENLEIRDSVKSYLYRTVYNRAVSILRKKKVISRYEEKDLLDLYFTSVIQNPQAEIRLINSETRKAIISAVESLPERCREVFVGCKIKGKSYAEVARLLDISEKTVENQITIALRKLREKLNWLLMLI